MCDKFECDKLGQAENQSDVFYICVTCDKNLTCPILNDDDSILNDDNRQQNPAPNIYCGECGAWTAYGEPNGIQTYEELCNYCKSTNCPCYGK